MSLSENVADVRIMPFEFDFLLLAGRNADTVTNYPAATMDDTYKDHTPVLIKRKIRETGPWQIDILYDRTTS